MTNFWPKNLLITHDQIGQRCTMFSKPRVCQGLLKMADLTHPLVPLPGSGLATITADARCRD